MKDDVEGTSKTVCFSFSVFVLAWALCRLWHFVFYHLDYAQIGGGDSDGEDQDADAAAQED